MEEITAMKHVRFSVFSLVVLIPLVSAAILQVFSNCWVTSPSVRWAPLSEILRDQKSSKGIVLVSYYSTADVATYYPHQWMSEHGGRVICQHRIQTYALDQAAASAEQIAILAKMFKESQESTGFGLLDLRGRKPRSKWSFGAFASEDAFERWIAEFKEGSPFHRPSS